MDALELSCDSGEEVNRWDTDNPFSSEGKDWDNVTVAEVKSVLSCDLPKRVCERCHLSCDTHYVVDDDNHKDPYDHGTGASSVKQQCCKISCDIVFEADSSLSCGAVFRCVGRTTGMTPTRKARTQILSSLSAVDQCAMEFFE